MWYREQYNRLIGESRLIHLGCECNSPVVPSDFDRLISGYRLIQTALLGDPPYCACLFCCVFASHSRVFVARRVFTDLLAASKRHTCREKRRSHNRPYEAAWAAGAKGASELKMREHSIRCVQRRMIPVELLPVVLIPVVLLRAPSKQMTGHHLLYFCSLHQGPIVASKIMPLGVYL